MTVIDRARALRAEHPTLGASERLRWARSEAERQRDWPDLDFDDDMRAQVTRDGFSIFVRFIEDDCSDTSWLGEFTNKWHSDALKNPAGWDGAERGDPTEYAWYVPMNSPDSAREYLSAHGYSRHNAWLAGQRRRREDMKRLTHWGFRLYLMHTTVYRSGIELADDYLGGVDLGDDYRTIHEQAVLMAADAIPGVIAEAKKNMKLVAMEFAKAAEIPTGGAA
jgi:hypothetical protein